MIGQFDTYHSSVCISPPNHGIDAQGVPGPLLRYATNHWAELKAKFLLVYAEEMSWTPSSQTCYPSTPRSRRPLRARSQNAHFWTLEDRMKRIQSRATLQRKPASPNLSRQSTIPDLKVLHAHYARQRMHGEAYDEYECGNSSPKRKRAVIGIRGVDKASREMLPFVRPRRSYQCSYGKRQPQWSLGVQGLADPRIDAIVDHEMVDVKDESWLQSNARPRFSIGADSTSMKHVVYGDFGVPRMFERGLASKKTTDPRPRPRPTITMVDIDMIATREPPSTSHHRNKSSKFVQAPEPMQTTADLMREIFGDGEVDDADSVLSMIRSMNIM
ncbi:uncharacterized protein F5147DRAFT_779959 [Suillus discolor]|uniref:Uncharacterized protein n=1 Tax=Suillus discolor TaxID=1912936 RepID=A0A9P7JN21_9AGAM|nr:uncharacterized protein F5147DRAFT_779959 [Suillus discolor]KAG2091491.1 hypothetical protein F5147DRAFT_779959 [Suillus discolor]